MKNRTKENMRGVFLGVGFLIALSTTITAFEWNTEIEIHPIESGGIFPDITEIIPITDLPEPKPPKPVIPKTITETSDPEIEIPEIELDMGKDKIPEIPVFIEPEPEPESVPDFVFTADVMPQPDGGFSDFYQKLGKEINYPRLARKLRVEGKVFIQFIVSTDGKLQDVQVVKGIGAGCDEEAVRALLKSGSWKPGKQRAVPVNVKMVIPVNFKLN